MSSKKDIIKNACAGLMGAEKSTAILNKSFEQIIDVLSKEGRIELRNFGVFELVVREARKCRNPRTGKEFYVPKNYRVKFKPSKKMMHSIIEEASKIPMK